MEGLALDGAVALASLRWQRADDDPKTWTARDAAGVFYIMTAHSERGSNVLDVSAFHTPTGQLLREWRWILGSTFDKLPDAPAEGQA